MFGIIVRQLRYYWRSNLAIVMVLLLMGLSFLFTLQTTEQLRISAPEILDDQWRSEYDLLVSPSTAIESDFNGLLRKQELEHFSGGISIEQYDVIKAIEGVQVAAPISFIGHIGAESLTLKFPNIDPGFYYRSAKTEVFDGVRYRDVFDPFPDIDTDIFQVMSNEEFQEMGMDNITTLAESNEWFPTTDLSILMRASSHYWSMIAIDPEEEIKLLDLDQAIVEGEFLPIEEQLLRDSILGPIVPLILLNQYYDVNTVNELYRIDVDESLSTAEILKSGGTDFLHSLKREKIADFQFNPYDTDHLFFFGEMELVDGQVSYRNRELGSKSSRTVFQLSPYQLESRGEFNRLPLYEAIAVDYRGEQINYRNITDRSNITKQFSFDVYGIFDSNLIESKLSTSATPKQPDFYSPEPTYITHDPSGKSYSQPVKYQNSPYLSGYYTGGVDAITTLTAAKELLGEEPISIIRVVIEGAGERSPESIVKIEQIAKQIQDETGLHVVTTLGSADKKVQVLLDEYEGIPGYGYLLEGWVQSGASLVIEDRVNSTNLLLGLYIFLIGTLVLFLLYRNYVDLRLKELKIQFNLGWSKRKISSSILLESLLTFFIILLVFIALRFVFGDTWSTQLWISLLILLPIYIISTSFFYFFPILKKLNQQENKARGIYQSRVKLPFGHLISYAFNSLLRLRTRTLLKSLIITISITYVYLFLMTKTNTSNHLFLTFLGENIDLALRGQQWNLFFIGIFLSIIALFALDINQIENRLQELQLFKVWGWDRRKWLAYYSFELLFITTISLMVGLMIGYIILLLANVQQLSLLLIGLLIGVAFLTSFFSFFIALLSRSKSNRLREFG